MTKVNSVCDLGPVDEQEVISDNDSLQPHTSNEEMNLSFCGCGLLGIYHLGVAKALSAHGPRFLQNVECFAGASAGTLVAALLSMHGADPEVLDKCEQFTIDLASKTRKKIFGPMNPRMSLLKHVEDFMHNVVPEDGYIRASGRLHISLTRKRKNYIISEFTSNEHLVQCILASCYIPYITGKETRRVDGKKFKDGGMTDNLPCLDNTYRTIFVSPFSGRQHICPPDTSQRYVQILKQDFKVSFRNMQRGLHAFKPPKREKFALYLDQGFQDTVRFLKSENYFDEKRQPSTENQSTNQNTSM